MARGGAGGLSEDLSGVLGTVVKSEKSEAVGEVAASAGKMSKWDLLRPKAPAKS